MVASGIDIMTVKEIFGHSNIKTTMNYVHLVAKNIQNVAKNFNITPQDVGSVTQLRVLKQ